MRWVQRALADSQGILQQPLVLHQPGQPLGVCILTSDFWGTPSAGGTATAYHLLAHVRPDALLSCIQLGCARTPLLSCLLQGSGAPDCGLLHDCSSSASCSLGTCSSAACPCLRPGLWGCRACLWLQVLGALRDELLITMLGVSLDAEVCQAAMPTNSRHGVQFECLQPQHFEPEASATPAACLQHMVMHASACLGTLDASNIAQARSC